MAAVARRLVGNGMLIALLCRQQCILRRARGTDGTDREQGKSASVVYAMTGISVFSLMPSKCIAVVSLQIQLFVTSAIAWHVKAKTGEQDWVETFPA